MAKRSTSERSPSASGTNGKSRFKQIAGYVAPTERDAFESYATNLGLTMSGLLNLLVRRELRLDRLSSLRPAHFRALPVAECQKVIAHLDSPSLSEQFAGHAARYSLAVASASAILIRAELAESWLGSAIQLIF
jgi:hypothetical protein